MTANERMQLGEYELTSLLGQGGMGQVWGGRHRAEDVPVAIKVVHSHFGVRGELRLGLRREVQTMARLSHPCLATILDYGEVDAASSLGSSGRLTESSPYLVMELADAGALPDVTARRPFGWRDVRELLLALLDALAHAHARGLIHRDLKPDNVLAFTRDDGTLQWKLTDFGVVHSMDTSAAGSTGTIAGTPLYMAPEQVLGAWRDFVPATDLYGLGCMTHELVCGRPPFVHDRLPALAIAHLMEEPPPLTPLLPVPCGFDGWVRRLLAKPPQARFLRAADARAALLALGDDVSDATSDEVKLPPPGRTTLAAELWVDGRTLLDDEPRILEPIENEAPAEPLASYPLPAMVQYDVQKTEPSRSHDLVMLSTELYGLRTIPIHGREQERESLWAALEGVVRRRRAHVVLLEGPSGFGKSRLAEWLCLRADELGVATHLVANHSPAGSRDEGIPAMLVRYMRCGGLTAAESEQRLNRLLAIYGVPPSWATRGLARLLAEVAEDSVPSPADFGPGERTAVVSAFLERIARWRPVIVWVDDLQWGDEARVLLESVTSSGLDAPVLFVATVQTEALAERQHAARAIEGLAAHPTCTRVPVGALDGGASKALLGELLRLDPRLLDELAARSGGNPLFAQQMVEDWVQRGSLSLDRGAFRLREGFVLEIPDDLHAVWAERVARLLTDRSASDRRALQLAAVLGRHVHRAEWAGVCALVGAEPTADLVDRLVGAGLATWADDGWDFVHGMLHESMLRLTRESGDAPSANLAVARHLDSLRAAGRPGLADRIGRHLLAADELDEALEPLLTAASERGARGNFRGALELLDLRDRACEELGRDEDALALHGSLERVNVLELMGRFAEAEALARRTEQRATELDDARLVGRALSMRAQVEIRAGRFREARALAEEALERLTGSDDTPGSAVALLRLGDCAAYLGEHARAAARYRQAATLFSASHDAFGLAWTEYGLGHVAMQRGDLDAAEAHLRRGHQGYLEIGATSYAFKLLNSLADLDRERDRLADAREKLVEILDYLEATGDANQSVVCLNLRQLAFLSGDVEEAREWSDRAFGILARVPQEHLLGAAHLGRVALAAADRDWDAWEQHLARATTSLEQTGVLEQDDAQLAALAAGWTHEAGDRARSARLHRLCASLWRRLDREGEARAAEAELARLEG